MITYWDFDVLAGQNPTYPSDLCPSTPLITSINPRLAIAQCYVLSFSLVVGVASLPVTAPAVHLPPAMCKVRKRTGISFGPFLEH